MTDIDPMAQADTEREILRFVRDLATVTEEIASAAVEAAKADARYDLAHARALLDQVGHEGTVPEKQARALVVCEDRYHETKYKEAVFKALQEKGRNLRAQLDALRSINANVRPLVTGR
jgi:hypothetical protein